MSEPLTDEQVASWRRVLIGVFGPYALIMPREQVQLFRDRMQAGVLKFSQRLQEEEQRQIEAPCQCDPSKHGTTTHRDGKVTCNKCGKERIGE